MCGGSADEDPDPTASELILSRNAGDAAGLHQKHILPLEMQEIARVQDADHQRAVEGVVTGRSIVDARKAQQQAQTSALAGTIQSGAGPGSGTNLFNAHHMNIAGGSAAGAAAGETQAKLSSRNLTERMGLLETGAGLQRSITSSLGAINSGENMKSIQDLKNKIQINNARGTAMGSLAMSGVAAGFNAYDGYQQGLRGAAPSQTALGVQENIQHNNMYLTPDQRLA